MRKGKYLGIRFATISGFHFESYRFARAGDALVCANLIERFCDSSTIKAQCFSDTRSLEQWTTHMALDMLEQSINSAANKGVQRRDIQAAVREVLSQRWGSQGRRRS